MIDEPATSGTELVAELERLTVHDHLCLIYETREEQFAAVVPFVRIGLERGERCVYIADDNTAADVMDAMRAGGVDVDSAVESGAFIIVSKRDAYLRKGYFDPELMIRFLKETIDAAKAAGYSALRATGEMTWALGPDPGVERLIEYEAKLNYFFPQDDILAICQYNRNRFSPEIILDVIRTHPLVVFGGTVCRNFYYVPPDEFLQPGIASREVDRLLGDVLERENYEVVLRESEERYRTVADFTYDWEFWIDPYGRFIYTSPSVERITGYSPDEFAEDPTVLNIIVHPEDREKVIEHVFKVSEAAETSTLDFRITRRDGKERWISHICQPVYGSDAQFLGRRGSNRDVTEQKIAERAVWEERNRAQQYFNAARVMLVVLSSDGTVAQINPKCCEVLGYDEDEIVGKNWFDTFIPERVRDEVEAVFKRSTAGEVKAVEQFENPVLTKSGEERIIDWRNTVQYDERGNIAFTLSSGEDITERKQAEEELSRLAAIVESSDDAIISKTLDGTILTWNRGAEIVYGYSANEAIGRSISMLAPPDEPESILRILQRIKRGEGIAHYETVRVRKDGRRIYVALSVSPIKDTTGRIVGASTIARDITESKKAEEERLANLRFFETMDQINRAIQGTSDLEQMMSDVLGVVLSVFDCDRAWLLYPCDPEAAEYQVPMERTRPEYPGAFELGLEIPMDAESAEVLQAVLASSGPVAFGPEYTHPIPAEVEKRFHVQSQIGMALYPKTGKAWMFGLHQCSSQRVWTPEEERLFQEIGRRLSDGLSSMLLYRDLRQSERQLRAASLYTRSLIESSLDPLVTISREGKITDVNIATELATGISRDQLIGSDFSDYFTEPEKARAGYEQVFREGSVKDYPLAICHVSGHITDVLYNATVYKDEKGDIQGVFAAARDVTERKMAEEALKKERDYLDKLRDSIGEAIFTIGLPERVIVNANSYVEVIFGYSVGESVGRTTRMLYPDEEAYNEFGAKIKNALDGRQEILYAEQPLRRKNGEIFPAEITTTFLKENGQVTNVISVVRDITERKKAEEALRAASLYTRSLIESSLDPLVTISPEGKITDVNNATELVTGVSRDQLIGSDFSDYFVEPEKAGAGYEQAFREGAVRDYPLAIRHVSGRVTDVLYNATVYRDEQENIQGVFAAARDVTERKRAEAELMDLTRTLERRVVERTEELEAMNRELEAFSYSVSHDLRAPLRSIDGFSLALIEDYADKLDPVGQDYLTRVRAAAQRMGQLIDDLLRLSRVTRAEMHRETVNLSIMAQEILLEYQRSKPSRKMELIIQPDVRAEGDRSLVRILLENLLDNAWKFTGKKPFGRIEFGVTYKDNERIYLISDNGAGFDMTYYDKLFKPFQRLHQEAEFPGTGIGLAIVQRIIRRHGGRVWAEGKIDEGATFYFTL